MIASRCIDGQVQKTWCFNWFSRLSRLSRLRNFLLSTHFLFTHSINVQDFVDSSSNVVDHKSLNSCLNLVHKTRQMFADQYFLWAQPVSKSLLLKGERLHNKPWRNSLDKRSAAKNKCNRTLTETWITAREIDFKYLKFPMFSAFVVGNFFIADQYWSRSQVPLNFLFRSCTKQ